MLVGTGVTAAEPFTSTGPDRIVLLRALHRMVIRADAKVTAADRAAVNGAYLAAGVVVAGPINYAPVPPAAAQLEKLITALTEHARYVVQPGAGVVNPPFGAAVRPTLQAMVTTAVTAFTQIAAGNADNHIRSVFALPPGDNSKVPEIRAVFAEAAAALRRLENDRAILADVRDELAAQGAAALTSPEQMLLPADFADANTAPRIRTLLHESFHAARESIIDHMYASNPNFAAMAYDKKAANADTYAQVARLHTNLQQPAPAPVNVVGGAAVVVNPAQTQLARAAMAEASHRLTRAWVRSIWSLQRLRAVQAWQASWSLSTFNELILRQLHRDSETCGLTLHYRAGHGRSEATKPAVTPFPKITGYDIAVQEEIVADLHRLVSWANAQATVTVPAPGALPPAAHAAWLLPGDLAALQATGLADKLTEQAIGSLPLPWFPTAAATKQVVDTLRIRDAGRAAT
jgi:hypothetical protein